MSEVALVLIAMYMTYGICELRPAERVSRYNTKDCHNRLEKSRYSSNYLWQFESPFVSSTSLLPFQSKMLTYATLLSLATLLPLSLTAPVLEDRVVSDRFTLYDLPTELTGPCDLEVGPDGASWGQV
jgi:hypothetical protein